MLGGGEELPARRAGGRGADAAADSRTEDFATELAAEAAQEAAPRLLVERLQIGRMCLLVDVHVAGNGPLIPIALDTHRCVVFAPRVPSSHSLVKEQWPFYTHPPCSLFLVDGVVFRNVTLGIWFKGCRWPGLECCMIIIIITRFQSED
jgi:hypothetical protein